MDVLDIIYAGSHSPLACSLFASNVPFACRNNCCKLQSMIFFLQTEEIKVKLLQLKLDPIDKLELHRKRRCS